MSKVVLYLIFLFNVWRGDGVGRRVGPFGESLPLYFCA